MRSALVLLAALIALSVQDFSKVLNFIGALTIPPMSFICPTIFYLPLCDNNSDPTWTRRTISLYERGKGKDPRAPERSR